MRREGFCAKGLTLLQKKQSEKSASGDSFEAVAREWFAKFSASWAPGHSDKLIRRLELYIFPWVGGLPIGKIEPPQILSCLRRIEAKGNLETAHRALQVCSRVFRYAAATGRALHDPAAVLRGALPLRQKSISRRSRTQENSPSFFVQSIATWVTRRSRRVAFCAPSVCAARRASSC